MRLNFIDDFSSLGRRLLNYFFPPQPDQLGISNVEDVTTTHKLFYFFLIFNISPDELIPFVDLVLFILHLTFVC